MNKNVWIGSAVGLLFLCLLGAGWWAWPSGSSGAGPAASSPVPAPRVPAPGAPPSASLNGAEPGRASAPGEATASAVSAEARRKRLNQIRAEMSAITAQGAQASPAQVQALLDELEALTPGRFDPRYFQALRVMLEGSGQVQVLNRELQALSSSTAPNDVAHKQAILAELQAISARISAAAVNLQTYSQRPPAQGKAP